MTRLGCEMIPTVPGSERIPFWFLAEASFQYIEVANVTVIQSFIPRAFEIFLQLDTKVRCQINLGYYTDRHPFIHTVIEIYHRPLVPSSDAYCY